MSLRHRAAVQTHNAEKSFSLVLVFSVYSVSNPSRHGCCRGRRWASMCTSMCMVPGHKQKQIDVRKLFKSPWNLFQRVWCGSQTLFLDSGTPSRAMHGGKGADEPGSLWGPRSSRGWVLKMNPISGKAAKPKPITEQLSSYKCAWINYKSLR